MTPILRKALITAVLMPTVTWATKHPCELNLVERMALIEFRGHHFGAIERSTARPRPTNLGEP